MGNNIMFYVFGGVAMLYLIVTIRNRQKSKDRKSRKFMNDYNRKNKK